MHARRAQPCPGSNKVGPPAKKTPPPPRPSHALWIYSAVQGLERLTWRKALPPVTDGQPINRGRQTSKDTRCGNLSSSHLPAS